MLYVQANRGAIPGNAWTSAAFLKPSKVPVPPYNDMNCPLVCQTWDWTAPIAKSLGYSFNEGKLLADRTARFDQLCRLPVFQCTENDIVMAPYSGSPVRVTTQMISFVTSSMFHYAYSNGKTNGIYADISRYQGYIDTGNYRPKITSVGNAAEKIFLADGARWTNTNAVAPDYNLGWDNSGSSPGGQYADYGPWSGYTRSYLWAPPYVYTPMAYSMRHGGRRVNDKLGNYKFNVVFFDGHAETIDGVRGMDPRLWVPRGTKLPTGELSNEANRLYGHLANNGIIAVN